MVVLHKSTLWHKRKVRDWQPYFPVTALGRQVCTCWIINHLNVEEKHNIIYYIYVDIQFVSRGFGHRNIRYRRLIWSRNPTVASPRRSTKSHNVNGFETRIRDDDSAIKHRTSLKQRLRRPRVPHECVSYPERVIFVLTLISFPVTRA